MCWSIVNGYTQFTDYDWGDIIMSSSSAWKQPKRRWRASYACRARVRVRVCVVGMRRGHASWGRAAHLMWATCAGAAA